MPEINISATSIGVKGGAMATTREYLVNLNHYRDSVYSKSLGQPLNAIDGDV